MHTLGLLALALLALIAGSLLEPPAARAASKARVGQSSPVSPQVGKPDGAAPFRIVSEDVSVETSRRYVAVVLAARLAEAELLAMADVVRAKEKAAFEKTVVNFYLPGMKIGQGPWAVATYNPAVKIAIIGLRLDEQQLALAEAGADQRKIVGVWLSAPPTAPGRVTIFKDGSKLFVEWRLRDGSKTVELLNEQRDPRGRHLSPVIDGTDYYLVTHQGDLEIRDSSTVIAIAERLPGFGEIASASPAKSLARARAPAKTATAANTGQALSDKLFKF